MIIECGLRLQMRNGYKKKKAAFNLRPKSTKAFMLGCRLNDTLCVVFRMLSRLLFDTHWECNVTDARTDAQWVCDVTNLSRLSSFLATDGCPV